MMPVLDVGGLTVQIRARGLVPVDDVSIAIGEGEIVGIVGESGCGKSTLLRAIAGVLPKGVTREAGNLRVAGHEVTVGRHSPDVAMVFQDPMTSLNPSMRVGDQVADVPLRRDRMNRRDARTTALRLMAEVGIPDVERRFDQYPHELSGGLRQRILIAAALSGRPKLLLCDEPTTALDVTVQAQIVELLRQLSAERGLAILYVTHDLPLLGTLCSRIDVMYAGQMIERGRLDEVLREPRHPYTSALLRAAPAMGDPIDTLRPIPGQPPVLRFSTNEGCRFAARCAHTESICATATGLGAAGDEHATACVRSGELSRDGEDAQR